MSSAYLTKLILFYDDFKRFVYIMNRNADNTQPCGEPVLSVIIPDKMLHNLTRCFLSVRKSIINEHSDDDAPMSINSLIRISGFIVLKAELKSMNRVLTYELLFSRCSITVFTYVRMASSVHLPLR